MTSKPKTTFVPCNGCTLCCLGDAIRLTQEDNPEEYLTEPHPYIPGALMLAHKPNGDCIYYARKTIRASSMLLPDTPVTESIVSSKLSG